MKRLDRPPGRVSYVDRGQIRVSDLDRACREAIAREGLVVKRGFFVIQHVPFEDGEHEVGNPHFERAMLGLNRAGLAFQEDYKTVSAADLMRELQANGTLVGSFRSVAYDGSQWIVRDNPPGRPPPADER